MLESMDQAAQHNRIDYIEITVRDIARTKAFYSRVFGWEFTDYGPHYTSFHDGRLAGGFAVGGGAPSRGVLVVMYSSDLEATLAKVKETGATVTKDIFAFPGGRRFQLLDPSGHEMAVWSE